MTEQTGFDVVNEVWVLAQLQLIQNEVNWADIPTNDESDDFDGVCVRLQVTDTDAFIHSGSADYDQDHRGYWGAASIGRNDTREDLLKVAWDLIEQAKDMASQED